MSIQGIKDEIVWVKKSLNELKDIVKEIDDLDLVDAFDSLESNLDDLIDECKGTISDIDDAISNLQEI